MSVESLAITAGFGGLAGSLVSYGVTRWRENKRIRMLRHRVYMQITYELTIYRMYLEKWLSTTSEAMIESHTKAGIIKEGDKIVSSFEYPSMPVELKLQCFEPPLHAKVQDVYREIASIELNRVDRSENIQQRGSFAYGRKYL